MFKSSYIPEYVSLKQLNQLKLYNIQYENLQKTHTISLPNDDKHRCINRLCNVL